MRRTERKEEDGEIEGMRRTRRGRRDELWRRKDKGVCLEAKRLKRKV